MQARYLAVIGMFWKINGASVISAHPADSTMIEVVRFDLPWRVSSTIVRVTVMAGNVQGFNVYDATLYYRDPEISSSVIISINDLICILADSAT